jgi:UDP-N-acetylmuramoyl-tripeptide--D-alanyl-D-alanine ligase
MIPLSAEEVGRALGTLPLGVPITGVSIDSRSIRPGDLFIALRGERFDGHDFVAAAFAVGAAAAVVEKSAWADRDQNPGQPVFQVDDTLEALSALARAVRRKSPATVFAITGSVGKTSTKDVLAAMVGRVRRTVATAANQNNEIGVPLTLLAIEPDSEAVIVEMGMRGLGQIAALAEVAEPDVGVLTNIHPVHLELLGCLENVARAKAELIKGVKSGGAVVVPGECEVLQPYLTDSPGRVVRFGARSGACPAEVEAWFEGPQEVSGRTVGLRWPEGEARIETGYLPSYRLENIAAAAAACYAAGLPVAACAEGIADVRFSRGRGEVLEFPGIVLVDDTYNANPAAGALSRSWGTCWSWARVQRRSTGRSERTRPTWEWPPCGEWDRARGDSWRVIEHRSRPRLDRGR